MTSIDEHLESADKAFKSMETVFINYSEDGGKSIPESNYGLVLMEIGEAYGVNDINADEVLLQMESDDGEKADTISKAIFKKRALAILKVIKSKMN